MLCLDKGKPKWGNEGEFYIQNHWMTQLYVCLGKEGGPLF